MKRPDRIVVSALGYDWRVAWMKGETLIRFAVSGRPEAMNAGDLVLGRVVSLAPALGAAFVEVGDVQPGLLTLPHGPHSGRPPLSEGDSVVVQVARPAEGRKGCRLTGNHTLSGRFVVFLPGLSDKKKPPDILPDASTSLIYGALKAVSGDLGEWRLRPAAAEALQPKIIAEATGLCVTWQQILARAKAAKPPHRLYAAPDPAAELIRDGLSTETIEVVVDDPEVVTTLQAQFPDQAPRIRLDRGRGTLLSRFGLEDQIEAALDPVVPLSSGGRLTITESEALVAIDIDSGATAIADRRRPTALAVNLDAMSTLADTIALRELSGHIVIDPVPVRRREERSQIVNMLKEVFCTDDRQVDVAGYTRLGLLELTRERRGPSLRSSLQAPCMACTGSGMVPAATIAAGTALREVLAYASAHPSQRPILAAAADVNAALDQSLASVARKCDARLGHQLCRRHDQTLPQGHFRIDAEDPASRPTRRFQ